MADFIFLYRGVEPITSKMTPQEMQNYLERFRAWAMDLTEQGHMQGGAPLAGEVKTLRGGAGAPALDGPFIEAKDMIGGFCRIAAEDMGAAIEIARGCPFLALGGTVEIRQLLPTD